MRVLQESGLVFSIVEDEDEEPEEVGRWDSNARRIRFKPDHRAADPALGGDGSLGHEAVEEE
eukprot:COSAG02_NODE_53426_length_302_cov_0.502463_1_plen_61_part_10